MYNILTNVNYFNILNRFLDHLKCTEIHFTNILPSDKKINIKYIYI